MEDWVKENKARMVDEEIDELRLQVAAKDKEIERLQAGKDGAYEERNRLVAVLAALWPSGIARTDIPGWDEEWHDCVYIDCPRGQLSWHFHNSQRDFFYHLPLYDGDWDGHTTEQKYERLKSAVSDLEDA